MPAGLVQTKTLLITLSSIIYLFKVNNKTLEKGVKYVQR